jgi:hypothetical protein
LRSRSTIATLLPARARATAVFARVVDLPSPLVALVIMIVLAPRSRLAKPRLVARMRKTSVSGASGSVSIATASWFTSRFGRWGIRPNSGTPSRSCTSSADRTRVLSASRTKASAMPSTKPRTRPSVALRAVFGWV